MSRQRDVDWSDWKGHVDAPQHPLSRPLNPKLKKGADVAADALQNLGAAILRDVPPQPTNQQMFGHLVPTEEQVKKAEKEWNNAIAKPYEEFKKPIDHLNKSKVEGSWGVGKSFNSMLSKEELAERNAHVSKID